MDEQLAMLARAAGTAARSPCRSCRSSRGAHAAAGDGSLAILQFDGAPGLGLVHLGGIGGGVCLEGQDDLDAYAQAFDQLRAFALSPAQSALLLRGLAATDAAHRRRSRRPQRGGSTGLGLRAGRPRLRTRAAILPAAAARTRSTPHQSEG